MIKEFKKGISVVVSEEFHSTDFDCKCELPECTVTMLCEEMVAGVTRLALYFPIIIINSGFRCPAHNADPKVGGKSDSQHLLGKAADIKSRFGTPKEIKERAEIIPCFAEGGIGLYPSFVHVDSRGHKARW